MPARCVAAPDAAALLLAALLVCALPRSFSAVLSHARAAADVCEVASCAPPLPPTVPSTHPNRTTTAPFKKHAAARAPSVRVCALDAAQPFDFEHRARAKLNKEQQLTIGIVGFGTFGQFLAKRMVRAGHRCARWVGPAFGLACEEVARRWQPLPSSC